MKFLLILSFFTIQICNAQQSAKPKKEFRAVWVATVENIDWPPTYNECVGSECQRVAFLNLLNMHKRNGITALIVQIRPAADAFYPSPFEPWSQWLTGVQGQAPYPYYDPLQFMIEETHKAGLEFHAWLNPYRAVFNLKKNNTTINHITRTKPEWFLNYGDKKYFDPGNIDAQQFVVNVVKDIVTRYKVDAIHMDDYFYPYRIAGKEFPDNASYQRNKRGLGKEAWRRSNTDSIIVAIGKVIKQANPNCKFGISPFGVWRNASIDSTGSNTKAGQTNYDDLYADILLWLRKGWVDYVTPQLYWEIGHPLCDFNTLADWWAKNTYGKDCYVGIGIYRAGTTTGWKNKNELPNQIKKVRSLPALNGFVFFNSKVFEKNPNGWSDSLRVNYFKDTAGK